MASFRREKTKRRHAKRRQDEITPREKTKRRHAKRRKTPREMTTKLKFQMASFRMAFFRLCAKISPFRVAGFVFSHGVISSFRMAFFRLFVFWHGVFSSFREASFRREKTKWHKPATIMRKRVVVASHSCVHAKIEGSEI